MDMRARLLDGEADEIYIIIKGYPKGFLIDKGEQFADYIKVPAEAFGSLQVVPPPGYYGTFYLTVIANATTNGTSSERLNVLKVDIARVLDVKLKIVPNCYTNDSKGNVSFNVSTEADSGYQMVYQSIRLTVPSVLALEDGNIISDSEYALDESELNGTITLSTYNGTTISGPFYINITINVLYDSTPAVMTDSVMVKECVEGILHYYTSHALHCVRNVYL